MGDIAGAQRASSSFKLQVRTTSNAGEILQSAIRQLHSTVGKKAKFPGRK
jgi:hypothetical protein